MRIKNTLMFKINLFSAIMDLQQINRGKISMVEFEQKLRGNIAVSVNPLGRKQQVLNHIDYVKSKGTFDGPKKVLIIGASSSYGLATRISLAFGAGADTIGVSYEKGPKSERNLGTAGWYNKKPLKKRV
jgi:enoyl-[acyl-carrier protein] reductase/trans-2-enoyl-CoA reductase (NAD+)